MAEEPVGPSAAAIARGVAAGETSAVAVVESALRRVERFNGTLNAVVTLNPRVLEDARAVDARIAAGETLPLAGVPVGIKDVTPVAGLRTPYGSPLYATNVPDEDALIVNRLRRPAPLSSARPTPPSSRRAAIPGTTCSDVRATHGTRPRAPEVRREVGQSPWRRG